MNRSELEELGERIAEHAAHIDAATHRLLVDIRAFDESGGWFHQGARSCAQWLSYRVGWDARTAREHVRVAHALVALPLIDDALRRGEISYAKVRAMTRVATPENQELLLEYARHGTGAQLERICRQYAQVRRHDAEARPEDDLLRRYLTKRDTADGMVEITARLHPEEAAIIWNALDGVGARRCRRGPNVEVRGDDGATGTGLEVCQSAQCGSAEPIGSTDREVAQATATEVGRRRPAFERADALVEIFQDVVRGTSKQRAPIDLVVTTSMGSLASETFVANALALEPPSTTTEDRAGVPPTSPREGGSGDTVEVAVLGDGTCVSIASARRLGCDCGVTEVVEDHRGVAISIGRKRRTIPGAMKRALLRRDRTCRFPGCQNRVFLEGHHVVHWADGGETGIGNLVALCSHHHRYLHEYGFEITITPDHDVQFFDARGRLVPAVPPRPMLERPGRPTLVERNVDLAITAETAAYGYSGDPVDYPACIDGLVRCEPDEWRC